MNVSIRGDARHTAVAFIGGLIMAVMPNGMQIMGIAQPTQEIVRGIVLVLAIAFGVYNKRHAGAEN
ncbi:hypothetical protein ACXET9_08765 [Brachybacterium sp. DNPG3]